MEKLIKAVLQKTDELVEIIKQSKEYKTYLSIKEKMGENEQIHTLIQEIKKQQQYVVRNQLKNQKEDKELKKKIKALQCIPLYNDYLNAVDDLNHYLEPIKKLQDYFDQLTK